MSLNILTSADQMTPNASRIVSVNLRDAIASDGIDPNERFELSDSEVDKLVDDSISAQRRLDSMKRHPFHNADHELMVTENGDALAKVAGLRRWLRHILLLGLSRHDFRHPGFVRPLVSGQWTNEEFSAFSLDSMLQNNGYPTFHRVIGYGGIIGTTFRPDGSITPATGFEALFAVADLGVSISRETDEEWIVTSSGVTAELDPEKRKTSIEDWIRGSELWFMEFVRDHRWHPAAEQLWGDKLRRKIGILQDLLEDEKSHPAVMDLIREHIGPLLRHQDS